MANLVQRGSVTSSSASFTVSLGTAINTSNSFILLKPLLAGKPSDYSHAYFQATGSSISSFTISRYGTDSQTFYWQVVSMDNISVQQFANQAYSSGSTSVSQTISTVTTGSTFCVVAGSINTTTGGNGYQGFFMADLTTSTNVNIERGASGTAGVYTLHVVSFTDSTTVQKATFNWSGSATNSQTISTVNLSSAWFVYGLNISSGGLSSLPNLALSDTTHITATRVATSGSITTAAIAYIVSMSGVSKEHDSGANIATDPTVVTVSNLTNTAAAFIILSNSSTGTGTSWANSSSAAELISTTEVDLHPANTSQTTAWELQTIQLPTNQPPNTPALSSPSNAGTVSSTTPTLTFSDTDPDGDAISYEVEVDTVNTFNSQKATITRDSAHEPTTNPYTSTANFSTKQTGGAFTPQANAAVFVVVGIADDGLTPSATVTDSHGNTYTLLKASAVANANLIGVYWFYYTASPGSTTISVQATNSSPGGMFEVLDYQGVSPTQSGNTVAVTHTTAGTIQGSLTVGTGNIAVGGGTDWSGSVVLSALADSTIAGHYEDSSSGDSYSSFTSTTTGTNTYGYSNSVVGGFAAVEVQVAGTPLIDALSSANAGFADATNPGDSDPFPSGDTINYTVQAGSALTNSTTYYWRVRGIDPSGSDTFGSWSSIYSFTVSTVTVPTDLFFQFFNPL